MINYPIYFSIGEAIAILGITIALPQYLKPVTRFRLSYNMIRVSYCYAIVFIACLILVAGPITGQILFPYMSHRYILIHQTLGAALFMIVFAVLSAALIWPPKVRRGSLRSYTSAAASLLVEADERDIIDFSEDIAKNIRNIVTDADFGRSIEFGDHSPSFFFHHRKRIDDAGYAEIFLSLLADEGVCRVLVSKAPTRTVSILSQISEVRGGPFSSQMFIRELSRQSILEDDSLFGRELGYEGFRQYPIFSEILFSNTQLRREARSLCFDPLTFHDNFGVTAAERFLEALHLTAVAAIDYGDFWHDRSLFSANQHLRWILRSSRNTDLQIQNHVAHRVSTRICEIIERAIERLEGFRTSPLPGRRDSYNSLFLNPKMHGGSPSFISDVSNIILVVLEEFSLGLGKSSGSASIPSITILDAIAPSSDRSTTLDPLRQRVFLGIQRQLSRNMRGFHPPLSRVVFSSMLPEDREFLKGPMCLFDLMATIAVKEASAYASLYDKDPISAGSFLPDNIIYNRASDTLARHFENGIGEEIPLSGIPVIEVDLHRAEYKKLAS